MNFSQHFSIFLGPVDKAVNQAEICVKVDGKMGGNEFLVFVG